VDKSESKKEGNGISILQFLHERVRSTMIAEVCVTPSLKGLEAKPEKANSKI
jgi:hypothetical protein